MDCNIEMKFHKSNQSLEKILADVLNTYKPDMVCLAALYYSGIHVFHLVVQIVKKLAPKTLVIMGGHYPTHLTTSCLEDPNVDAAILAEGELGLSDCIDALRSGSPLENIEGIAVRSNSGVTRKPRKHFWKGFAESPRLPWEDTPFNQYFRQGRMVLDRVRNRKDIRPAALTASRGCPHHCTFCSSASFWKRVWRKRQIPLIIDEINYLKNNHDINTIIFNDENIPANRQWFLELLRAIEPLDLTWISSGGLSVRAINSDEVITAMVDSGIGFFNLAFESGSDETLDRVKKAVTIRESLEVVERIRRIAPNAYIIGFFIIGFPFEDRASVQKTICFAASLDLDWKSFYCFQPFPGTKLYDECHKAGLIDKFNCDYGEVYFPPDLSYPDYNSKELGLMNYEANIRVNFIENRNLLINTPNSLSQAERDFRYVLSIVPDHVFAMHGLARTCQRLNRPDEAENWLINARKALDNNPKTWAQYVNDFGLQI